MLGIRRLVEVAVLCINRPGRRRPTRAGLRSAELLVDSASRKKCRGGPLVGPKVRVSTTWWDRAKGPHTRAVGQLRFLGAKHVRVASGDTQRLLGPQWPGSVPRLSTFGRSVGPIGTFDVIT